MNGDLEEVREAVRENGRAIRENGRAIRENGRAIRENRVLIESNRGAIEKVADYVLTVDGKLDRLRSEMQEGFREQRRLFQHAFGDLDRRVTDLEGRVE